MAALVLHSGATVICAHAGQAKPTAPDPRVKVGGRPVVVLSTSYVVTGCTFVPPAAGPPCLTATWIAGATRVLAGGVPILLQDSRSICQPTGTPLTVLVTQPRVKGT
jgi:hypothetical protein